MDLYGTNFLSYNVHVLLHLADDVQQFGHLDNCSGFPFENYLQQIKQTVRSGRSPLVQIMNRMAERTHGSVAPKRARKSRLRRNNFYMLDNNSCCEVVGLMEGSSSALCQVWTRLGSYLENEFIASQNIGWLIGRTTKSELRTLSVDELTLPAIYIDGDYGNFTVMAILHSLEW